MSTDKPTVIAAARSDPIGAGLVVCVVLFFSLSIAHVTGLVEEVAIRVAAIPWRAAKPGPLAWLRSARPDDVLSVPGYPVAYWGKPDAAYGIAATNDALPPVALVIHHTADHPLLRLVKYGHVTDGERGGSYGYHFYIDRDGRIVQGAPLTRRTNHVKPMGATQRKPQGGHLWNANSIGVSMVGGCILKPGGAMTEACEREDITPAQMEAGIAVTQALRARYKISCKQVFGHGELQHDREAFEGTQLARRVRDCKS